MMLLAVLYLFVFVATIAELYGSSCNYMRTDEGATIQRYEGKFNVPIKPDHEPGKVLFLGPYVLTDVASDGIMVPTLTYGHDYGQGSGVWGMANWFTNCPSDIGRNGYCFDQYLPVNEGDVISFSMQHFKTLGDGKQEWIMSWESLNQGHGSAFMVELEGNVTVILSSTAAFLVDPAHRIEMPRSNFYTWDLFATASDGRKFQLNYTAQYSSAEIKGDCDITVTSGLTTFPRAQVHVMPNAHCPEDYSRGYNISCQIFCGCNNADGTAKIQCDYCCSNVKGFCERAHGPSYIIEGSLPRKVVHMTKALTSGVDEHGKPRPAPGQLAQKIMAQSKKSRKKSDL